MPPPSPRKKPSGLRSGSGSKPSKSVPILKPSDRLLVGNEGDAPETKEEKARKLGWLDLDPNSFLKEERLRIHKETFRTAEEDAEVEKAVAEEMEERAKKKWFETVKDYAAKVDVFAAAHTLPKHQVCIWVATIMIPMSILTITWDLLAAIVFQIPHFSTINAPGFILFINFIAMPLAMYGYMMEYLMHEHSRMATIGLICVVVHPILFFIRAFMEYWFDGFRYETKLYFESQQPGVPYEYPIRNDDDD